MKLKGIILAVILSLASIMMPFSVYADTITSSNIKGLNTRFISKVETNASDLYLYEYELVLDKNYVGWVSVQVVNTYYSDNNQTQSQNQFNKAIYVNGNSAKFNYSFYSSGNYSGAGCLISSSYSLIASNVLEYGEIESLEQIIDLLTDINDHISIDVISELQNIVSNTSLANDYLDEIRLYRQWNIPIESISGISYMFNKDFPIYQFREFNDYQFPIFTISPNDIPLSITTSNQVALYSEIILIVMWDRSPSVSTMNNYMPLTDGKWKSYERLYQFPVGNKNWCIAKYIASDFTTTTASNNITHLYTSDTNFTPIYFGYTQNLKYVSTDFALNFGLSNSLLDDIHTIANGTNQSNSAASDLESGNSQMADDMDDLATIENDYNEQFNNQLQQIDFSSPLQNNAGILPAANFVITIFNGLVNNPFSVLIMIVSILLIGKKVIGG